MISSWAGVGFHTSLFLPYNFLCSVLERAFLYSKEVLFLLQYQMMAEIMNFLGLLVRKFYGIWHTALIATLLENFVSKKNILYI